MINHDRLIIMTSVAKMPATCWGQYRNVAIVELDDDYPADFRPAMISTHARGVQSVVRHYGPQNVGKTARCAYQRTIAKARDAIDRRAWEPK